MADVPGLAIRKATGGGWRVVHEPSGLGVTAMNLRLQRHAVMFTEELRATGVDFTQPAEQLKPRLDAIAAVAGKWHRRAINCCDPGGEHYDPYSYRLPSGRCSSERHLPRRS